MSFEGVLPFSAPTLYPFPRPLVTLTCLCNAQSAETRGYLCDPVIHICNPCHLRHLFAFFLSFASCFVGLSSHPQTQGTTAHHRKPQLAKGHSYTRILTTASCAVKLRRQGAKTGILDVENVVRFLQLHHQLL